MKQNSYWSIVILVIFILEMAIFSFTTPGFFNFGNWMSMTNNFIATGVMALSMMFVIIAGGIDLSVGSTVSLCGVVMGVLWKGGMSIWLASIIAVLIGGMAGLVNGLLIVRTGIQPLIATLATMFIYGSLAMGIGGLGSISGFPITFLLVGSGFLYGVLPIQLIIFLIIFVVFHFILQNTTYGRLMFFIGNNQDAAAYSGVPVNSVKTWTYVISGLTSGLAAIMLGSYFASVRGDMGIHLELTVITLCLVGGVNVFGGFGNAFGVMFATLLLGMLQQGLNLLNVSSSSQLIITGIILILAVAIQQINMFFSRRKSHLTIAPKEVAHET